MQKNNLVSGFTTEGDNSTDSNNVIYIYTLELKNLVVKISSNIKMAKFSILISIPA